MNNDNADTTYDLIVIGSGMGSLTTASLMASIGKKRVLVLESGSKLGGFLHTFRRGDFNWDPGLHYVSGMEDGNLNRRCMDLVTGGRTRWHKMSEYFEKFIFPEGSFMVSDNVKKFEQDLIAQFPTEAKGIKRYFKDMHSLQGWANRWYVSKQYPAWLARIVAAGKKLAQRNTAEYLDSIIDDQYLKAILTAQWPDYGTPPGESALGIHAIIATAFFKGGYYPIGGPDSIIKGAKEQIESNGGKCLRRHEVTEILIKDNRAYGVRVLHKGKSIEFHAQAVVSGAGVVNTFEKMVAPPYAQKERRIARNSEPGRSAVILYLGLNDDPRNYGFEDCNYWIYKDSKHQYYKAPRGELPKVQGAFLSFGSLRNPGQNPHTAQIVTFDDATGWTELATGDWMRRGEEYEARKKKFTDNLLDFVEDRAPGIKQLVDYAELSSPLTVESFLSHPGGQIYGRASTPERISNDYSIGTSVKNLYLTGSDIVNPGVDAAMMVGVMTAGKLLGWTGMARIMTRAYTTDFSSGQAVSVEVKEQAGSSA